MPDGNAIRQLREAKGWSQRELAERATVSEYELECIEHDEHPHAEAGTIYLLARTLGVAMVDLLSADEREGRTTVDERYYDSAVILYHIAAALEVEMESLMRTN